MKLNAAALALIFQPHTLLTHYIKECNFFPDQQGSSFHIELCI